MAEDLVTGDRVRLENGPVMRVISTDKDASTEIDMAYCEWFVGTDVKRDHFAVAGLVKVP
jgi:uncharacterized protein YodC (DUF2158 family)